MQRFKLAAIAAGCLILSSTTYALEFGVILSEESEYTTNSGQTDNDEVEEWIHSPGIELSAEHEGPAYDLNLDYRFAREIYQQDLFDDQNEVTGIADVTWRVLPERLDFIANHTRTQSAIRAIAAATPDNRQETYTTSAGPILRFNPRGNDQLEFQYQWFDRGAEESDVDSITHESTVRYIVASSQTNSFVIEAINRQVQYDNGLIPDLEYDIARVGWLRTGADVNFSFYGGFNNVQRTNDRDDVDGFSGQAELEWQANSRTTITLSGAREMRDQSERLTSGRVAEDLDYLVSSDLGEVFTNTRGSLGIAYALDSTTSISAAVSYDEEDYEDVGRDSESITTSLVFSRALNNLTDLAFSISNSNQDFMDEGDDSDRLTVDLNVSRSFGRRLDLVVGLGYEERDDDGDVLARGYEEWIATISLRYVLAGAGR